MIAFRFAILSDIHANLHALEAVLADARGFAPDAWIVAGDLVGCPQADETLEMVRALNPWIIRGNTDLNLVRLADGRQPPEWYTSKRFRFMRWVHSHISTHNLNYLRGLPDEIVVNAGGAPPIRVVHASLGDPFDGLDPVGEPQRLEAVLGELAENVLVCGHTHRPWKHEWNSKLALNPGAVCGPLNGDPRAQYALLDWEDGRWQVQHRAVDWDHAIERRAFEQSGLLAAGGPLARAFLLSNETGIDVGRLFLEHVFQLAEGAQMWAGKPVTDDVWNQAEAEFDWGQFEKEQTEIGRG